MYSRYAVNCMHWKLSACLRTLWNQSSGSLPYSVSVVFCLLDPSPHPPSFLAENISISLCKLSSICSEWYCLNCSPQCTETLTESWRTSAFMIYGHLDMITLATISFPILPWQIVSAPTPEKRSGLLVCNSQAELPEQQVYVCPECLGENKK